MTSAEPSPVVATNSWTWKASNFDLLVIAWTTGCALATLSFASEPVTGTKRLLLLGILWPLAGIGWAASIAFLAKRKGSLVSAVLLLVGAAGTFMGFLPFAFAFVFGPAPALVALGVALALFGVILALERPRRLVWLIAPAIVLSTIGIAISGAPRSLRFDMSEPFLTRFAAPLLDGQPGEGAIYMEPTTVAGVALRRGFLRDGCAHFVTTHVGIFGGGPAGIAYCPEGFQGWRRSYEPLAGSWYRWWRADGFD